MQNSFKNKKFSSEKDQSIDVSIIVACYNGEKIIEDGVNQIKNILAATNYSYEFIFVDDCSKDNSAKIAKDLAKQLGTKGAFLQHEQNKGRGKTVSDGINIAKGRIVGFIDIDLETPAHYIIPLIKEIENGADIATARRIYKIDFSSPNTLLRYILHKGYRFTSRKLLRIPEIDTETGCKFFKKQEIKKILDTVIDERWFWDTEIMVRSYYAGLKIKEVPTIFIKREDLYSTVKIFRDTKDYFINLLKFRKEIKKLKSWSEK